MWFLQNIYFTRMMKPLLEFKVTLKAFDDFKNTQKSFWSNVFWYVIVCIFWKCIQYTIHWDKTQMLKKFLWTKQIVQNKTFFLLKAPSHHSFTFNLLFLYELKYNVRLSKTVCGIFYFQFRFVFIKVYIFVQQNVYGLFEFKRHNSYQKWNNRKITHSFVPRPLIFKLQHNVLKFNDIFVSWSSPKLTWWSIF